MDDRRARWTRRHFVGGLTVGLLGASVRRASAQAPPETTTLRLVHDPSICVTPQYLAEELLRADGFTRVQYVEATDGSGARLIASGGADMMMEFPGIFLSRIDVGEPILILGGIHSGCFEVFGGPHVRTIRDLKGKQVAVLGEGAPEHLFLSSVAAYVGLDPRRDIRWVTRPPEESIQLFADGKVDALAGFPPTPQELRARKVGHVLLDTANDRPWSQYFCCMVGANREFVRKRPIATKRALRAILKGADLCAAEPERAARFIVSKGYTGRLDYAAQSLRDIPYTRWRDHDPESTVRFYVLRLHEVSMVKSSPAKLLAQGTDWRFIGELRKELKA